MGLSAMRSFDESLWGVQAAVEAGADVNSRDQERCSRTPLHIAARQGNFQAVELLLSLGADIEGVPILPFLAWSNR